MTLLSYLQHANSGQLTDPARSSRTGRDAIGLEPGGNRRPGLVVRRYRQDDPAIRYPDAAAAGVPGYSGLTVAQQQQAFALDRDSPYAAWQAVGQAMVAGANYVNGLEFMEVRPHGVAHRETAERVPAGCAGWPGI